MVVIKLLNVWDITQVIECQYVASFQFHIIIIYTACNVKLKLHKIFLSHLILFFTCCDTIQQIEILEIDHRLNNMAQIWHQSFDTSEKYLSLNNYIAITVLYLKTKIIFFYYICF